MDNEMDTAQVRFLLGDVPTLDHDVQIDARPDQHEADVAVQQYAELLRSHHLTDRYGVFRRKLSRTRALKGDPFAGNGYGIYIGPHTA